MWKFVGLASLVVLVASESFAFFGAVLWALAELFHLGKVAENGAIGLAALIGVIAGAMILKLAMSQPQE